MPEQPSIDIREQLSLDAVKETRLPLPPPPVADVFQQGPRIRVHSWRSLWASIRPSLSFLIQTEVHVYAFAVAVNVLLTFFPFLVAIILLCRYVLHWNPAVRVILHMVDSYFPPGFGVDMHSALLAAAARRKFSWISVFLLLFTANGIFVPLEVAFNHIWQVKQNRSFLRNQVISLGLIFACGALFLLCASLATINVQFLTELGADSGSWLGNMLQTAAMKIAALPVSILIIFVVYWGLPNARIRVRRLVPASIAVGILLEVCAYLNIVTWPWLHAKLSAEVPPFVQSISIILWSFMGTMILLAGAEWSARVNVENTPKQH